MCGRYFFGDRTAYEIEREFGFETGSVVMEEGDVVPSASPIVLSGKRAGAGADINIPKMFWGLTGKDKKLIINARAESALDKPMFAGSVENRRCVMPAAGFYEWDRDKNKVTFYRKDRSPIYLAGFYQLSENKDSFVILTTAANESMIKVHDRMPLMIDRTQVRDWLNDAAAAKEMKCGGNNGRQERGLLQQKRRCLLSGKRQC